MPKPISDKTKPKKTTTEEAEKAELRKVIFNQALFPRLPLWSKKNRRQYPLHKMRFPKTPEEYPHAELTKKIIGAAITVAKEIRPGLDEKIYENSLCIEFAEAGLNFQQQPEFPVHYKGRFVGKGIPDLIVENKVVVDTKVVKAFNEQHDAQMLGYLVLTNLEVGLLLNFKTTPIGKRRILNPYFKK